ncbi:MAG TPA: lysophospholipid acyltransferase family protein [Nitrospirota bacterium]|jgi:hypothetical protein
MGKLSEKALVTVVPFLASIVLRILKLSLRMEVVNRPKLGYNEPVFYAFWHDRILMMPYAKHPGKKSAVMISRHRDGELVARLVGWFGISAARGSTTRGGMAALKEIINMAKQGYILAFTPDGPKGPRHIAQPGVIQAARATGLTIYPVAFSSRKKKVFRSWDRFILPHLFSKAVMIYGRPLTVPRDADEAMFEAKRLELEQELNRITDQADNYWG